MGSLGLPELAVCIMAVTFAFAVRGATGFGASTVAIPHMAFALPISLTVPLVSCLIIVSAVPQVFRDHERIAWREILKTLPFSLVGVVLGLLVFPHNGQEPAPRPGADEDEGDATVEGDPGMDGPA